jgi:hypothetical protein
VSNSLTPAALAQPNPVPSQLPQNQAEWQQFATTLQQWLGTIGTATASVTISVTAPSIQVPATSGGVVTDFSHANGQANVLNGTLNVNASTVFSLTAQVNCTASITAGGLYSFSALTAPTGSITIQAIYQGLPYTIQVSISMQQAGAPATPGLSLTLSDASAVVLAYASGVVPSFAGINGQAHLLSGGTDVSESATWSAVSSGLTGTVNTADNVPVAGQPIGYYQVTAMTSPIATLTISATYSSSTVSQVFTVTQVPTGYQIVSALPTSGPQLFPGNVVFLSSDNQLYRYTGTAWTASVPAVGIVGQLTAAQIQSIASAQITGQLTAAQIASLATSQLTGQITTTQIANNAITTPLIAAGAVNTAQLAANSVTAGTIAANTITAAQIAAGAITSAQIAAGTITAGNIAAQTILAGNIAANTITGNQIAAGTITANNVLAGTLTSNQIQAGSITAASLGVSTLSSISANIGTVTAGVVRSFNSSAILDLNNDFLEFNNSTYMYVNGINFGSGSNYIAWYGPTQSSASNFAACTDALGVFWLKTDGTAKFGNATQASSTTTYTGPLSTTVTIPAGKQQMIVEDFADSGAGGHGDGSTAGGGGGSGGYCKSIFNVSAAATQTISLNLQGGGSNGAASTVSSGTFTIPTMSATGGSNGSVGAGAAAGTGGSASGGNTINQGGFDGGNANSTRARGQGVPGTYGSGNPGAAGAVSATTNNPGLPALCFVTFI